MPVIRKRLDQGMIGKLRQLERDTRNAHWQIWRGYWVLLAQLRIATMGIRLWRFVREFWPYLLMLATVIGFLVLLITAPQLVFTAFRAIGSWIAALLPDFGPREFPNTPTPSVAIAPDEVSQ